MKAREFREWLTGLSRLSRGQRDALVQRVSKPIQRSEIAAWLEQGMVQACPACGGMQWYRWGRQADLQRFRCRDCGKTFTVLSGTPLARLRHKDCWATYAQALIEGLTVRQAAAQCGVDKNTSFRWRHRFLTHPAQAKARKLYGIAEADETYFPLSFKGQRHLPRPARRRGHSIRQRGTGAEQVPVLILRDRQGATADFKLTVANTAEIEPVLQQLVATDAVLCSDGAAAYRIASQHLGLAHRAINLSAGRRGIAGVYHIQNVNAYDSRLKGWMHRFHGVATKYLENYLGWRRWLERWGNANTPQIALDAALGREKHFQLLMQT